MSRASVRAAVRDFLSPPYVTYVDSVYPNFPADRLDGSGTLGFPSNSPHEGWIVLFIENTRENRITSTNPTQGLKAVTYRYRLEITYQSRSKAEAAQEEFDTLMDSLHERLRSNSTFASADIFEACEGPYGVQGNYLEPVVNDTDQIVTSAGTVRFEVTEHVWG